MIIPSIDLMNGRAVQLVEGRTLEIDAGDPRPLAERFARLGEFAVIDLDAALGRGSNRELIEELVQQHPCRVGGGIRDVATARRWLDLGARKVILGTAATPEILSELPRERVIAALDAREGEVVVEGWTQSTGEDVVARMRRLNRLVGGFLVTFVESEGHLGGLPVARVAPLLEACEGARLTVAGGVRDAAEIGALDARGVDAQVGMALYRGRFDLADALLACVQRAMPDALIPTMVCDERGLALGLVWSNEASLREALDSGEGVYWSRSRNRLWRKGATSGATQALRSITPDCDRDVLRVTVCQQDPGFCHENTRTCFGEEGGLGGLARRLVQRVQAAPAGSYTRRLLDDPVLLAAKLREEAGELAAAEGGADVRDEAADLLYFALVALARAGVPLSAVEETLDRRALKITRRPGDAKSPRTAEVNS